VGAAYQRQANGIVSNSDPDVPDIVSSLQAVEASQRAQVNTGLATAHRAGTWLHAAGWLLFAALVLVSIWLSRTFRRIINLPVAAAAALLFLLLVIGGTAQAGTMRDADGAVRTQLSGADNAAQARAAAFEARSQEALTLINRGNGAVNEANWQRGDDVVTQALETRGLGTANELIDAATNAYGSYRAAHAQIRKLDDDGNWDGAVAASLDQTEGSNSAVEFFNAFDQNIGQIVDDEGSSASQRLGTAVEPLSSLRNIVFVVGLVVAVLAALGCGQRLKEYR
jgi:hypothetical protein